MYSNVNFCSKCGSIFESDDSICKNCGNDRIRENSLDVYQQYHCSECGEALQSKDKYCPKCGNRSGIPSTIVVDDTAEKEKQQLKKENSLYHAFIKQITTPTYNYNPATFVISIGLFILVIIIGIILYAIKLL